MLADTSTRQPFQVLVFPYRFDGEGNLQFALFKRVNGDYWQAISGGGEREEQPLDAARRESSEEAGISSDNPFLSLLSQSCLPAVNVVGLIWGEDVFLIPEFCFAVKLSHCDLKISDEHSEYRWMGYEEAMSSLKWESNKTALWELNYRLTAHPDLMKNRELLAAYRKQQFDAEKLESLRRDLQEGLDSGRGANWNKEDFLNNCHAKRCTQAGKE